MGGVVWREGVGGEGAWKLRNGEVKLIWVGGGSGGWWWY